MIMNDRFDKLPGDPSLPPGVSMNDIDPPLPICDKCGEPFATTEDPEWDWCTKCYREEFLSTDECD